MKYGDENIIGQSIVRPISPKFELTCQEIICASIVNLMTEKGIYQNILIDFAPAIGLGIQPFAKKEHEYSYNDLAFEINNRPWQPISKGLGSDLGHELPKPNTTNPLFTKAEDLYLNFYLPEIIISCKNCTRHTTHLSMASSGRNFIESIETIDDDYLEQYFVFHYKCSICRKTITSFLITRHKNKITLCGRNERLKIDVDNVIPKKMRNIVSDAISSINENDKYAGFYHLRTFIEHYAKDVLKLGVDLKIKGDDLYEQYNKELGSKISSKIPSLSSINSELSKYLHSRTGEKDNFDLLLRKIIDHLKAIELYSKYS